MPLTEKRELGFHSTLADRFFAPPLFSHVHAGRICGRVCLFILGHLHPSHFVDLVCTFLSGLLRLIWTQPLPCACGLSSVTAFGSRLFCPSHLHNVQPWPLALCFGLYFSSPVHRPVCVYRRPTATHAPPPFTQLARSPCSLAHLARSITPQLMKICFVYLFCLFV